MAIQGLIIGYANPSNNNENLILVGREDVYLLIKDGKHQPDSACSDMGDALKAFGEQMGLSRGNWAKIEWISSDALGNSTVGRTNGITYGDHELVIGFANPKNNAEHVLLVTAGYHYVPVKNGQPQYGMGQKAWSDGKATFEEVMGKDKGDWLEVKEIAFEGKLAVKAVSAIRYDDLAM